MIAGFTSTLAVITVAAGYAGAFPAPRAYAFAVAALLAAEAAAQLAKRADPRGLPVLARGSGMAVALIFTFNALGTAPAIGYAAASFTLGASAFTAAGRLPLGRPIAAVLAVLLLAWTGVQIPQVAEHVPGGQWRLVTAFAAAVATLVGTLVARHRLGERPAWRAFTESEAKNLLVVLPVTAIVLYRGVLARVLRHIEIYEWALGLVLALYAVAALRARYRDEVVDAPWSLDARVHAPDVDARPDAALAEAARVFTAFVDEGRERDAYVAFFRGALSRAGVPDEEAARVLARVHDAADGARGRAGRGGDVGRDMRGSVHRALLARVIGQLTERSKQDDGSQSPPVVQPHS